MQIAHELLNLDRGLIGQLQDAVATFRVEQSVKRETNPGSAPEQPRLATVFFAGASFSASLVAFSVSSVVASATAAASPTSCDDRQKRRLPFACIVSALVSGFLDGTLHLVGDVIPEPARAVASFVHRLPGAVFGLTDGIA